MKLGEVEVDPTSYVDDVANLREGATEAGRRMSNAVNEMSLKAHQDHEHCHWRDQEKQGEPKKRAQRRPNADSRFRCQKC